MYWLRVIAVLLVAALLQATIVPALAVRGARADLLLLVAVCLAVREHPQRGWRWRAFWIGWAAGLVADIYSVGAQMPFGVTALIFGLLGMAVSKLGEELFVDSCIAQVLIMAPVCIAAHCALAAVHVAFGGRSFSGALGQAFWTGMYSGLVAPLAFAAMKPLQRYFGVRPQRSFGRA